MEITPHKVTCPCCGYPELGCPPYEHLPPPPWFNHGLPPYSQRYGAPSYEVCACCGFEFGNDDEPGTASPQTFAAYLTDWIGKGCVWFDPQLKPEGWNLESQLNKARIIPNPVTRIEHPELGTLHFRDGKQDPLSPRA
jgi:hypothetical protein